MDKKSARLKRAKRTRCKIRELEMPRLCLYRTPRHIYVQLITPEGDRVVASASTTQQAIREQVKYTGNIEAAQLVGKTIADAAIKASIKRVAFDRSGFKYHGRVKALADAARDAGLEF